MGDVTPAVMLNAVRAARKARAAERSLYEFMKQAWDVIEPGVQFQGNWHLEAICEHLEAISKGKIQNLLINIPPGCCKSILVSVAWPAWEWVRDPKLRFMGASYGAELAIRDAMKTRDLITSEWYQGNWDHVQIKTGEDQKTKYALTSGGWRMATSVGGRATGEHPDRKIVDDPHNAKQAESNLEREGALTWFDRTLSTRGKSRKARTVVVMQRLHEKDLSGHILADLTGYDHLCIPMEYAGPRSSSSLGWKDPRTQTGELMWPKMFDEVAVGELKATLGSYGAAGQLAQTPSPSGGGLLKGEWFGRYRVLPRIEYRMIYADTAQKTAERNDYSVFECWGMGEDGKIYLLDLLRDKWESPELRRKASDFWEKHKALTTHELGPLRKMKIEDKASGTGLIQDIKRDYNIPVEGVPRDRDKYVRMLDTAPYVESGRVMIPESAPWVLDFVTEAEAFTANDTHMYDDQLDPMMDAITDMLAGGNKLAVWSRLAG